MSPALCIALALAGQSDDDARRFFDEGVAMAREERWDEALAKFEASRAIRERPSTLFNIGTALLRLKRPVGAAATFTRFIEIEAAEDRRDAARKLLDEAEASVVRASIALEPPEAMLTVDGRAVAANGPVHRLTLDPGTRTFEARADGYEPKREVLILEPGARIERTLALLPLDAAAVPEPPIAAPLAPPPPIAAPEPATGSIFESPWFWVVAGVVVVAASVGVGVGIAASGPDPSGGTTGMIINP